MDLQRTIRQLGGTVERVTSEIGVLSVRGLTDRAAAQLAALPEVEGVAPDRQVQWLGPDQKLIRSKREAARVETDQSGAAFFADQWNLRVIQADDAWLTTPQGEGALVCVLDTGVDPTHVDLAGKVDLATSVSFVPSEPTILDFNLHGTAMASVITSNGLGMASVAPDARICAVKVLDQDGSAEIGWILAGIVHAANVGADVINMSLGLYFFKKGIDGDPGVPVIEKPEVKAFQRAVNYASSHKALVVASAGNEAVNLNNNDIIHVPSDLPHVVSVGATAPINQQNFDRVASYSNFGKHGVDVFAPGGDFVEGSVVEDLILTACSSFNRTPGFEVCTTSKGFFLTRSGDESLGRPRLGSGGGHRVGSAGRSEWSASRTLHPSERR